MAGYDRRSQDALQFINSNLYKIYHYPSPISRLASLVRQALGCSRASLFSMDDQARLLHRASSPPLELPILPEDEPILAINTFDAQLPSRVVYLNSGSYTSLEPDQVDARLSILQQQLGQQAFGLMPLLIDDELVGLIVAYNEDGVVLTRLQIDTLKVIALSVASAMRQAERIVRLETRVEEVTRELDILQRLDTELADIIELDYVFRMTMDWALRFSNADAASMSLYDPETDTIQVMAQYGHRENSVPLNVPLREPEAGISLRVARSGRAEIVPDVSLDKDFYAVADGTRTQLTVPIMREEMVIAVLALESRKLNGFTEEHQTFVNKLTKRAGVAVDNARLFTETRRERERLQHILGNIADIVIIVGDDNRIAMMNYSAILGLRLPTDTDFIGQVFSDAIRHEPLAALFREAVASADSLSDELELPDNRIYHIRVDYHDGIGHIIVMQDITHFKETERLKTELVATVSHDLKQPLSVMRGYLDLLKLTGAVKPSAQRYIDNLEISFSTMRQLIDDLLDIAHIEAGLELDKRPLDISAVLRRCIELTAPNIEKKRHTLTFNLPEELPKISGDDFRLQQIFTNLISNAIKYTPPQGTITIRVELNQKNLRVFIEDNGMGIGPEDQTQIFNRFYRVRRPETDEIEGTGLGLAIVKSLIEAHGGKIDLKSALGNGSTFRVQLPLHIE